MRSISFIAVLLALFVLSCNSTPETPVQVVPAAEPVIVQPRVEEPAAPPPPPVAVFDAERARQERYDTVMEDVTNLIANLNRIIRARDYNSWRNYLSDSFFEHISSQAFLESTTEDLFRRDQAVAAAMGRDLRTVQRRVLRNARDYFDHIVVPSRSNDRVDDIDFISDNRVRAFSVDTRGNRVILYDLELINGNWLIVN